MSEIEKTNQMYRQYMADKKKKARESAKVDKDYIVEQDEIKVLVENNNRDIGK